jgi:mannose-1-phosphate guanylyltransferase
MIALPADHFISDKKGFLRTLERAAEYASREDYLITLGIQPTTPETGYGYIQRGILLGKVRGTKVFKTKAFREKPTLEKAKAYLRRGDYLWNSGMFIWKVRVFLEAVEKFLPQLHRDMLGIKDSLGKRGEKGALESIYAQCPSISVDYGIMEKAPHVAVIQASFHWDDIGSWSALWNLWPKDRNGNVYIKGKPTEDGRILAIDSTGCMIRRERNLIAVLGLKNMAVVEAGDAFLVCPLERSQDVRRILQQLKAKGWNEYL